MATSHHMTMEISVAINKVKEYMKKHRQQDLFSTDDGKAYISNEECLKQFFEFQMKGYTYIPCCDNVDSRGMCKGHEVKDHK